MRSQSIGRKKWHFWSVWVETRQIFVCPVCEGDDLPNILHVSPARTHRTIPDRPIAAIAG